CRGLTSVIVENGNSKYDSRDNCNAIIETETNTLILGCKNTTIPNSVTSIGNYAFYDCDELTSITIPNSVTTIEDFAFQDCTGLTSITIPNSVTSIGIYAFLGCRGLTSVIVENGNSKYDSRDNCNAIIETETSTLILGCKNTTIPNSVTSIGIYAFYDCDELTSITIPNSVTSIGIQAFIGCTGLTSITIPNSVTTIGEYAFSDCTGLTSVTIPNSLTTIGHYAFASCSGLTSIYVKSTTPPTCWSSDYNPFKGVSSSATVYVPTGSKTAYETTYPWDQFSNIVEMDF
ncbi:MAG: leucine-rich repeat domain-containing protein, partial [Bacteroidaceae bacterium]|nr:leucine-rich repeat domain-containing protein [Bacteroidaceae bacterium]